MGGGCWGVVLAGVGGEGFGEGCSGGDERGGQGQFLVLVVD